MPADLLKSAFSLTVRKTRSADGTTRSTIAWTTPHGKKMVTMMERHPGRPTTTTGIIAMPDGRTWVNIMGRRVDVKNPCVYDYSDDKKSGTEEKRASDKAGNKTTRFGRLLARFKGQKKLQGKEGGGSTERIVQDDDRTWSVGTGASDSISEDSEWERIWGDI